MARSFKVWGVRGLKMGSKVSPLITGGGAAHWANGPAPSGFRWDFVTYLGERVTYLGEPVVALVGTA